MEEKKKEQLNEKELEDVSAGMILHVAENETEDRIRKVVGCGESELRIKPKLDNEKLRIRPEIDYLRKIVK